MPNRLTIIYERGQESGWVATIAEVPGAFSQGRTRLEARRNVIDALAELMKARRQLALRRRTRSAEVETVSLVG